MTFKKKIITCLILMVVLVTSLVLALTITNKKSVWVSAEGELKESYRYYDKIEIPDEKFVIGGETYDAEFVVEYPSGKSITDKIIILDEVGNYTIQYFVNVKGSYQYKTVQFFTSADAYEFENKSLNSSAKYDTYTKLREGKDGVDGLIVSLAPNDTLVFNQLLDLEKMTEESFVAFFITPEMRGTADFTDLVFTLYDAEDFSNYLTFNVHYNAITSASNYCWATSAGNNQSLQGFESGKGYHPSTDGWGTPVSNVSFIAQKTVNEKGQDSWGGKLVSTYPGDTAAKITYNYVANKSNISGTGSNLLAEYTDVDAFGDNLWYGFKSSKVRLEITAKGNSAGSNANFVLTSVLGVDLTGSRSSELKDDVAPIITIDTQYDVQPFAKVNKAYKLPTATAYDQVFGECAVTIKAVYNYTIAGQQVDVPVNNGEFTPTMEGDYAIVYSAKDPYGNVANKVIIIRADETLEQLTVTAPQSLLDIQQAGITLGLTVKIDDPIITGGSGGYTFNKQYLFNGEKIDIVDSFVPDKLGNYTIIYTATDYLGNTAKCNNVVLNATAPNEVIFDKDVSLPLIMVDEISYTLPKLVAKDYTSGTLKEIVADAEISYAGETDTQKSGTTFTPNVEKNGDIITITYKANGTVYKTFNIPVIKGIVYNQDGSIKGGRVELNNFFYGENINTTYTSILGETYPAGICIEVSKNCDNSGWTFATPQVSEGVSFVIRTIAGQLKKFESFKLTLIDAENNDLTVTLEIEIGYSTITIRNGYNEAVYNTQFAAGNDYTFTYKNGKLYIDNYSVEIENYDNGNKFNGFPSSKVYIKFMAVKGISSLSEGMRYIVKTMNEQALSSSKIDRKAPSFALTSELRGYRDVGEIITIPSATVADVFNPNSTIIFSLIAPDGKYVVDNNGLTLKDVDATKAYTVTLEQYGDYKFKYTASEVGWNKNSNTVTKSLTVVDNKAPTVSFVGGVTTTAKKGNYIKFADYKITDNSTDFKILKAVITSNGKVTLLDTDYFVPLYSGNYTFRIVVSDSYGNLATAQYTVKVS